MRGLAVPSPAVRASTHTTTVESASTAETCRWMCSDGAADVSASYGPTTAVGVTTSAIRSEATTITAVDEAASVEVVGRVEAIPEGAPEQAVTG